jgi:hypothetical protein
MLRCSNCNREWPVEYRVCPTCGQSLAASALPPTPPPPAQSGGVNLTLSSVTIQGDITGRDKISAQGDVVGRDKVHAEGGGMISMGDGNINPAGGSGGTPVGQPALPEGPEALPPSDYDLQAVRELLNIAFSDEEIVTLAFDRFRAMYEDLSGEMPKSSKIRRLVDWCARTVQVEALLDEVKLRNPNQYANYAARVKRQA